MTKQTEAQRLADALLEPVVLDKHAMQAAAELRRQDELLEQAFNLIRFQREWIDAVPNDATLPAMPGFDGDWAEQVIDAIRAHREAT